MLSFQGVHRSDIRKSSQFVSIGGHVPAFWAEKPYCFPAKPWNLISNSSHAKTYPWISNFAFTKDRHLSNIERMNCRVKALFHDCSCHFSNDICYVSLTSILKESDEMGIHQSGITSTTLSICHNRLSMVCVEDHSSFFFKYRKTKKLN